MLSQNKIISFKVEDELDLAQSKARHANEWTHIQNLSNWAQATHMSNGRHRIMANRTEIAAQFMTAMQTGSVRLDLTIDLAGQNNERLYQTLLPWDIFPRLTNLKRIDITIKNSADSMPHDQVKVLLEGLSKAPALESLSISGARIPRLTKPQLAPLKNLRFIKFSNCRLAWGIAPDTFTSESDGADEPAFSRLKGLCLSDNLLDPVELKLDLRQVDKNMILDLSNAFYTNLNRLQIMDFIIGLDQNATILLAKGTVLGVDSRILNAGMLAANKPVVLMNYDQYELEIVLVRYAKDASLDKDQPHYRNEISRTLRESFHNDPDRGDLNLEPCNFAGLGPIQIELPIVASLFFAQVSRLTINLSSDCGENDVRLTGWYAFLSGFNTSLKQVSLKGFKVQSDEHVLPLLGTAADEVEKLTLGEANSKTLTPSKYFPKVQTLDLFKQVYKEENGQREVIQSRGGEGGGFSMNSAELK